MSEIVERGARAIVDSGVVAPVGPRAVFAKIMADICGAKADCFTSRDKHGCRLLRFDIRKIGWKWRYDHENDEDENDWRGRARRAMRDAGYDCEISISNGGGSVRAILVDGALR